MSHEGCYADDPLVAHPFDVKRYPICTREYLKHSLSGFRAAVGRGEYTLDEILSITERFKKKRDEFVAGDLELGELERRIKWLRGYGYVAADIRAFVSNNASVWRKYMEYIKAGLHPED